MFVFGAIIGSFLNVVVYRYGTGQSVAAGRSKCFACRKTLAWYELVPIISFVALRAKCLTCKTKISWQYPLVEFITAITFLGIFSSVRLSLDGGGGFIGGLGNLTLLWIAAALLIAIAAYDWRHMIIPDGLVYGFIGVSALSALLSTSLDLYAFIVSFGLFIFFAALWYFSRGTWMGFGDAKLVIGIGLLLGWPFGVSAVVIAFWLGAVIGVISLLVQKLVHNRRSRNGRRLVTMKTEIPFAPFLVLATLVTLIFHLNVIPTF